MMLDAAVDAAGTAVGARPVKRLTPTAEGLAEALNGVLTRQDTAHRRLRCYRGP